MFSIILLEIVFVEDVCRSIFMHKNGLKISINKINLRTIFNRKHVPYIFNKHFRKHFLAS